MNYFKFGLVSLLTTLVTAALVPVLQGPGFTSGEAKALTVGVLPNRLPSCPRCKSRDVIPVFYDDIDRPVRLLRNGLLVEIRPMFPLKGDTLRCLSCSKAFYVEPTGELLLPWLEMPVQKGTVGCGKGGQTCANPSRCLKCVLAPIQSQNVQWKVVD